MERGQIVVHLQPVNSGAYTELWLSGCLPTSLPPRVVRKAVRWLALHSGWPVECVLCAADVSTIWWDWWAENLSSLSEHHLELHNEVRREDRPRGIF
jgi:hypothetical protein